MLITEELFKKMLMGIIFLTFLLLLFKNPFSERNLIPNLEPYPDSIHYLNPPLSFLKGKGFAIEREGRTLKPSVPFLYSASLMPGFFINRDVRFFYFTNIVLAFLGLVFFYKFLEKFLPNSYINLLIMFLYATNYFIYWYPNLPMAENLILTLYLIGLYLLVSKLTVKNACLAGLIGISFYATKYASVSLTVAYFFIYSMKIFLSLIPVFRNFDIYFILKNPKKFLQKNMFSVPMIFIVTSAVSLFLFFLADSLIRGNNVFLQLLEHAGSLTVSKTSSGVTSQPTGWFAWGYFNEHLRIYLNAILGNRMKFLWDSTPLIPKYLAYLSIVGILASLFTKQYRFISLSFMILIILPILAISPFYTTDARYIYHVIPTILTGFGLLLALIYNLLSRHKLKRIFYIVLITAFAFYAVTNFQRIKYQIALNLRHAETPWYYMTVKNFNNYFQELPGTAQNKPVLVTALQPFYIDFFGNSNYNLLPLSKGQEFMRQVEDVWGPNDYSDLTVLYKKFLKEGRTLYVSNAALGNEGYLHSSFNKLSDSFLLDKVQDGCYETCNIYRLVSK